MWWWCRAAYTRCAVTVNPAVRISMADSGRKNLSEYKPDSATSKQNTERFDGVAIPDIPEEQYCDRYEVQDR